MAATRVDITLSVLLGVLILSIWPFSIRWLHLPPIVLPSPSNVLSVMAGNFSFILIKNTVVDLSMARGATFELDEAAEPGLQET